LARDRAAVIRDAIPIITGLNGRQLSIAALRNARPPGDAALPSCLYLAVIGATVTAHDVAIVTHLSCFHPAVTADDSPRADAA
jgi:hypothetical protein